MTLIWNSQISQPRQTYFTAECTLQNLFLNNVDISVYEKSYQNLQARLHKSDQYCWLCYQQRMQSTEIVYA